MITTIVQKGSITGIRHTEHLNIQSPISNRLEKAKQQFISSSSPSFPHPPVIFLRTLVVFPVRQSGPKSRGAGQCKMVMMQTRYNSSASDVTTDLLGLRGLSGASGGRAGLEEAGEERLDERVEDDLSAAVKLSDDGKLLRVGGCN